MRGQEIYWAMISSPHNIKEKYRCQEKIVVSFIYFYLFSMDRFTLDGCLRTKFVRHPERDLSMLLMMSLRNCSWILLIHLRKWDSQLIYILSCVDDFYSIKKLAGNFKWFDLLLLLLLLMLVWRWEWIPSLSSLLLKDN